jgi:hypothetical protein
MNFDKSKSIFYLFKGNATWHQRLHSLPKAPSSLELRRNVVVFLLSQNVQQVPSLFHTYRIFYDFLEGLKLH